MKNKPPNPKTAALATNPKARRSRALLGESALAGITDKDIGKLQEAVFDIVTKNLPRLQEIFAGTRKWDRHQVALYLALVNKVMPNLQASHNTHDHHVSVDDLTPAELRRLAAQEYDRLIDQPPPVTVAVPDNFLDQKPVEPFSLAEIDPTEPQNDLITPETEPECPSHQPISPED